MQVAYRSLGISTVAKTCEHCYNSFIIVERKAQKEANGNEN